MSRQRPSFVLNSQLEVTPPNSAEFCVRAVTSVLLVLVRQVLSGVRRVFFPPLFLILSSFQDYLVFVVGKLDGLMTVSGRRHNADDVVATALAVEPMKFVYRGR